jgi:hypothetical protein
VRQHELPDILQSLTGDKGFVGGKGIAEESRILINRIVFILLLIN